MSVEDFDEAFDDAMDESGLTASDLEPSYEPTRAVEPEKQVSEGTEESQGEVEAEAQTEPASEAKAARVRDEKGKFVKKESQSQDDQPQSEVAEQEGSELEALKPHGSLSKEEKEEFQTLPRPMQEFVNRRAKEVAREVTQGHQERAQLQQYTQAIKTAVEPYKQLLRPGMSEVDIVKGALQDLAGLSNPQTRMQTLTKIALASGVTPQQAAEYFTQQPQVDPAHLRARAQAQALAAQNQQLQQQQQSNALQPVEKAIATLKAETNQDGTPKRVHFDAVQSDVAKLIEPRVAAMSVEERSNPFALYQLIANGYDEVMSNPDNIQAGWQSPDLRNQLLQQKERQNLEQARSRTASAKKTKTAINGAGTVDSAALVVDDIDGAIDAAFATLGL